MRNFCFFFLLFFSISLTSQNVQLKMPTDLYYARTPSQNKRIKFNINTKLTAINLIATDNQSAQKVAKNSINRRANGRPGILVAIPKLYRIAGTGNAKVYSFGREGGENKNDDATVTVRHQAGTIGIPTPSLSTISQQQPVLMGFSNSDIHAASARSRNQDLSNTQEFLKIQASSTTTATIEIDQNSEQGNCIVAIFNSKNGNFLGSLNPKDPNNDSPKLSITVDMDVYIVPVIRPKVTSANGIDTIIFEVGDPEENGSATSEEE